MGDVLTASLAALEAAEEVAVSAAAAAGENISHTTSKLTPVQWTILLLSTASLLVGLDCVGLRQLRGCISAIGRFGLSFAQACRLLLCCCCSSCCVYPDAKSRVRPWPSVPKRPTASCGVDYPPVKPRKPAIVKVGRVAIAPRQQKGAGGRRAGAEKAGADEEEGGNSGPGSGGRIPQSPPSPSAVDPLSPHGHARIKHEVEARFATRKLELGLSAETALVLCAPGARCVSRVVGVPTGLGPKSRALTPFNWKTLSNTTPLLCVVSRCAALLQDTWKTPWNIVIDSGTADTIVWEIPNVSGYVRVTTARLAAVSDAVSDGFIGWWPGSDDRGLVLT
eukprot:7380350-Prymnesium_polylepis.1